MAEITRLGKNHSNENVEDDELESLILEPKVVEIAKLGIIIASPNVSVHTKTVCIDIGVRLGWLTEDEARQLIDYTQSIMNFALAVSDDTDNQPKA